LLQIPGDAGGDGGLLIGALFLNDSNS